jgi:hypothetical protein
MSQNESSMFDRATGAVHELEEAACLLHSAQWCKLHVLTTSQCGGRQQQLRPTCAKLCANFGSKFKTLELPAAGSRLRPLNTMLQAAA